MSFANGLFGIGYQGRTADELVEELRRQGVGILADVRLNAISRKAGFSKRALSSALERAGIRYVHLRSLGNERDNRGGYAEVGTGGGNRVRERYRAGLAQHGAAEAIEYLATASETERVAVFCFEEDGAHCHREQVLAAVSARRAEVVPV
jgi:uncharacterized protein (DUF488 family)